MAPSCWGPSVDAPCSNNSAIVSQARVHKPSHLSPASPEHSAPRQTPRSLTPVRHPTSTSPSPNEKYKLHITHRASYNPPDRSGWWEEPIVQSA